MSDAESCEDADKGTEGVTLRVTLKDVANAMVVVATGGGDGA